MDIADGRLEQQLRIEEILGLEREPAIEVWKKIEAGDDAASSAEELGFQIEYFYTLLAQEFVARLNEGKSFLEFPKLSSDLETYCWQKVSSLCATDLPTNIEAPLCKQFRLKLLSSHHNGVPLQESIEMYNLKQSQAQALLVIALAEDGNTLNEIGAHVGVTPERTRQILKKSGLSTRTIKKQRVTKDELFQEVLTQTIVSWITSHPGCRLSEVSSALGISESDVKAMCPKVTQRLLVDSRKKVDSDRFRTFTRQQMLDALKQAYKLSNPSMSMYSASETRPLTGPLYEKLRNENAIHGPSQPRILQVFGTWKEACNEAGVPSVDAVRDSYELRWTDEELINQLAQFISTSESVSVASFDAWCRLDNSRASSGTLRNQIGAWSESYELGLMQLRHQWISD